MSDPTHPDQVSPHASGSGSLGSPSAIPTSDAGSVASACPVVPVASTVSANEPDHSAAATSIQMGEDPGGLSIAILPSRSSSIPTPDKTSTGQDIPTPGPSEPILLPSTRIEASGSIDQATLSAAIASLYLRLDLQQAVVDRYQSMETALEQLMIQNRQLSEDLQELRTSASPFVQFVQSKYDCLRARYEDEVKQSDAFREALADRVDQTALIEHLKSQLIRIVRARHAAQEKADREVAGVRKQMDDATERWVAEVDKLSNSLKQAKRKKSKYKKTGLQLREKLCRALKQVSGLQAELVEVQDSLSARSAECEKLRRIASDRDVTLCQVRVQLADMTSERDHAIEDHASLRQRMASLVSGDVSTAPTTGGSSAPAPALTIPSPTTNIPRSDRKRSRDPLSSSALPPPKKMTRSAVSTAKSSPVCSPKVARSVSAKHKPSTVPDPKPSSASRDTRDLKGRRGPKTSSAPQDTRDPKGRRDPKNHHDPAKPAASLKPGKQRRRDPSLSSSEEEDTSAGEDETLAALSSSRSSSRRRATNPAAMPSAGPSPDPIVIDSPSPPRDLPPPVDPVPPAKTKTSRVDLFGEASSDSEGAISLSDSPRAPVNSMLSLADYDSLPPTKISRDQWIPGYRDRVPRSSVQVSPWSARRVSWTSVAEMDIDFLYHHLSRPRGYIFPTVTVSKCPPPASEWTPRLVCSTQIAALYAQAPWEMATRRIAPISFPRTGWYDQLASLYLEFEDRNRQALWESTHAIFLSSEQRASDPELDQLWKQRKQRRSRAGPRWKAILRFILQGMIAGHCDLDILLDPFFLHFPSFKEVSPWYPGFGCGPKGIPNLISALPLLDAAEPWRSQYSSSIAAYPGSSIVRLPGKFFPA